MRSVPRLAPAIATLVLALASAGPLLWAAAASLRPEAALFQLDGADTRLTLEHYRALFTTRGFWLPLRNSLVVATLSTALAIAIGVPCAWALARLELPARGPLLGLLLVINMLPQIAVVGPLYLLFKALGLINSFAALVIPYLSFSLPLAVWLLVGVVNGLPAELEEAARVDGASRLRAFREVTLPLASPGIVASAIITFVFAWNEFLFALSFTLGPERQTVPVAIALFRGRYQVPWGEVFAAALVATAPVALVVLGFERRIVRGLTAGALKQ